MTKRKIATDDEIVDLVREFCKERPWGATAQDIASALGYKWTVQVRARLRKLEINNRVCRKVDGRRGSRGRHFVTWHPVGTVLERR